MPYKYIKAMVNNEAMTDLKDLESTEVTLDNATTSKILLKGTLGTEDSSDYTLRLWMNENVTAEDTDAMNTIFLSEVTISILIWNESKSNTTSNVSITVPHPNLVALKDSDERFKNLSSSYVLLPIRTGYTFNSETGKYVLTNVEQLDPTTLDYINAKYYFCNAGYSTSYQDIVTVWKATSNCVSVYELSKASFTDGTATGFGGTSIKMRKYTLNGYVLTQTEEKTDKSDKGLYQMEDDDGMSYYYRGSVTNNYVKFVNFYWRIIRINGDGISNTKKTYYGAYQRNYQTKSPILTCPNENDRFTVTTNKKGNKALKYSIGLIAVDELMLYGFADGYINKLNYTYTDRTYWTMSPGHVDINTGIRGCYLYKAGDVRCSNTVKALYDVRAVINIKGDAKISGGIGTSSSPYIIQTP